MKLGSLNPSRVLGVPSLYRLLGTMFGRTRQWQIFARDYLGAQSGDRILDVGCGPADVLTELPTDIDYTGFDQSEDYIDSARRRYGVRGQFFSGKVDLAHIDRLGAGSFDIVIAHGLLHHLDDRQATELFALARAALRPGGRLIIIDMVRHDRSEYRDTMGHLHLGFDAKNVQSWTTGAKLEETRITLLRPDPEAQGPGLFAATAQKPSIS